MNNNKYRESLLTQPTLKDVLNYNPKTGLFHWKIRMGRRGRIGDIAGWLCNGYIRISINNDEYTLTGWLVCI